MAEPKKCPKCSMKFTSQKAFQRHYAAKHYKPKVTKKKTTWKVPGFAKKRK